MDAQSNFTSSSKWLLPPASVPATGLKAKDADCVADTEPELKVLMGFFLTPVEVTKLPSPKSESAVSS